MAGMLNRDDEIAALYQVPPGEFTAARNALAKQMGAAGAEVRTLEKPQAAAWAVNQLYWQRRPAYDALIHAAQTMRAAHANMLAGRKSEVPQAESAHRDAIRTATQAIRELATAAGESLSASTLEAVSETLQALPADHVPGQLTRPLKPLGFGALMQMNVQGPGSSVQGPVAAKAAAKKAEAERAKRRKALEKALRVAETVEREAEAALAEAQKAVAKVERDYAAVRDRLQFLEKQRSDVEQDAHRRARELQDASNARTQAAQDLHKV